MIPVEWSAYGRYLPQSMSAHLERVLTHASRKLEGLSHKSNRDQLDLYRNFLRLEQARLRMAHRAGEGGIECTTRRADLFNVILKHMFNGALESGQRSHDIKPSEARIALVAVGGYGRGQLSPHSDIDILFLYEKFRPDSPHHRFVNDVVEQVLYLLWDSGIKVGHASRTLEEVIDQGRQDFMTLTALLESRLLDGPDDLFTEFQRRFHRLCIQGRETAYLEWRLKDQTARHEKFGNTVFVQEPQVKNGCGGLRDYHNLIWSAHIARGFKTTLELQQAGLLTLSERKAIDQAYDFLLRIRTELHYQQDRAGDILTLRLQGGVANAFKYPQRHVIPRTEALMREYYTHSSAIYHTCQLLFRRLIGKPAQPRGLFQKLLPGSAARSEKIHGFTLNAHNELEAPPASFFSEEPARMVQAYQIIQQRNAIFSPELESLIRHKAHLITRKTLWDPAIREMLLSLASPKGRVGRIFRAMHQTGILGRLIPEFAPLTFLVQHEFFHRYTADEHTLVCLEQLDRVLDDNSSHFPAYRPLFERCTEPAILYLALVLHDTGKADHSRDHSNVSSQLASRFARRMRIGGRRRQLLIFLVDHHMTLTEFALRRNLDEPSTIRDFARIVQDEERLDLLMLLSLADGMGTGTDNSWTDWKEGLVWHLYTRTRYMLAGEEEFLRHTEKNRAELETRLRKTVPKAIDDAEFTAHIRSLPERYLTFRNEALIASHIELVHQFLFAQLNNESVADALKPVIGWRDLPSTGHSEVTVVTWDRHHLFAKIAGAFALAELNILSADIWTRSDHIVIDTFRVCTEKFEAATHAHDRKVFTEALTRALQDGDYNIGTEINRAHSFSRRPDHLAGMVEPMVGFDSDSTPGTTVMHLRAADYLGLLYDVSACLAGLGLSITNARITTEMGAAMDTFYLTTSDGTPVTDRSEFRRFQRAVIAAMEAHLPG
ncbi:MAG: [protein-PII] uridylyltransferase [Candidatus Methylacidiphilales bacterium]|nr:[protein-PII] uridylyltransferase [Candidatus Methylacidiphilales bacterium]